MDTVNAEARAADVPVIDLQNATFSAGKKAILSDVSWRVDPGEHWAVLGPNGAGKTTLLKMVCGYLWPNGGGKILRNGQELLDLRELRKSIGWVSASLSRDIPPRERVLNVVVSGKYAQIRLWEYEGQKIEPEVYEQARRYLEEFQCLGLADEQFGTLSQGEQQKVLIARARMAKPLLIILDEPCAGLDPGAREVFLQSLQELAERISSLSLVLVTHHIEEIMPAFGKLLVLKDGRILHSGPTKEVLQPALFEQLYGISANITERAGRFWPICS